MMKKKEWIGVKLLDQQNHCLEIYRLCCFLKALNVAPMFAMRRLVNEADVRSLNGFFSTIVMGCVVISSISTTTFEW